jgi:thiol:disulfide interchange protein
MFHSVELEFGLFSQLICVLSRGTFNMRHILVWLSIAVFGMLLTACGTVTVKPTTHPTKLPKSEPTSTPLRALRNIHTPTEYNLLYYPTDLKLVGITGRPQFINAYADWCQECQRNRDLVHTLQGDYGDRVDFLHVDVENPGAMDTVGPYGITGKTQYLLLNGAGEVVQRWYGVLNEVELDTAIVKLWNEAS